VSGEPTRKAPSPAPCKEFIARLGKQRQGAELFGKLEWIPGYDYKAN